MNDIDVSTFVRAANTNGGGKPDFSRIRTIDGLDVKGKRVLVRVDFNVPMQGRRTSSDTTRIKRVLADHQAARRTAGAKVDRAVAISAAPKAGTMT